MKKYTNKILLVSFILLFILNIVFFLYFIKNDGIKQPQNREMKEEYYDDTTQEW